MCFLFGFSISVEHVCAVHCEVGFVIFVLVSLLAWRGTCHLCTELLDLFRTGWSACQTKGMWSRSGVLRGPPALSDSHDIYEETIEWHTANEDPTPGEAVIQEDDEDTIFDDIQGVPPVEPTARAMLDAAIERRSSLETTIDLTDSPIKSPPSSSSGPLFPQSSPSLSSPSSSLKCPVCPETFSAICKGGIIIIYNQYPVHINIVPRFPPCLHSVWPRVLWAVPACLCQD